MTLKTNYHYEAVIVNVVDGDTIDALVDLGFNITSKMRLRLFGIDTKEINSKIVEERDLANKAKDLVTNLLLNKRVLLQTFKPDKYGRYLANIYETADSVSINDKLISEGLAVAYFGGAKE